MAVTVTLEADALDLRVRRLRRRRAGASGAAPRSICVRAMAGAPAMVRGLGRTGAEMKIRKERATAVSPRPVSHMEVLE